MASAAIVPRRAPLTLLLTTTGAIYASELKNRLAGIPGYATQAAVATSGNVKGLVDIQVR